jgi:hypothetical protein
VATDREDVATENDRAEDEQADQEPLARTRRLKRGPVEVHLPTRDQIPAERLDVAYQLLVRFVARQVRLARRKAAANDEA